MSKINLFAVTIFMIGIISCRDSKKEQEKLNATLKQIDEVEQEIERTVDEVEKKVEDVENALKELDSI